MALLIGFNPDQLDRLEDDVGVARRRVRSKRGRRRHDSRDASWVPSVDIYEVEKEYAVYVELPGVRKEDIDIDSRESTINVAGELKKDEALKGPHVRERRYGKFSRSITLPRPVDTEKISAKFEHGVLEIKVPKFEPVGTKKIAIQ
jgi:HSP20 family protein